jgi:hypothetical protein
MEDSQHHPAFSTETRWSTRKQLGGTIYGQHQQDQLKRLPPHVRELVETICGDPLDKRKAEIVGLIPSEPYVAETMAEFRQRMRKASEPDRFLSVILERGLEGGELQEQWAIWKRLASTEASDQLQHLESLLWESQEALFHLEQDQQTHGTPNKATVAPLPKYELFLWTTSHLLPLVVKKIPTLWPVYCHLWLSSPQDFTTFKLSNRRLAEGAGVSLRSVPDAVDWLHELKLITAKKGLWSSAGPKAATLPTYQITPLEDLKKIYCNGATATPFLEEG